MHKPTTALVLAWGAAVAAAEALAFGTGQIREDRDLTMVVEVGGRNYHYSGELAMSVTTHLAAGLSVGAPNIYSPEYRTLYSPFVAVYLMDSPWSPYVTTGVSVGQGGHFGVGVEYRGGGGLVLRVATYGQEGESRTGWIGVSTGLSLSHLKMWGGRWARILAAAPAEGRGVGEVW